MRQRPALRGREAVRIFHFKEGFHQVPRLASRPTSQMEAKRPRIEEEPPSNLTRFESIMTCDPIMRLIYLGQKRLVDRHVVRHLNKQSGAHLPNDTALFETRGPPRTVHGHLRQRTRPIPEFFSHRLPCLTSTNLSLNPKQVMEMHRQQKLLKLRFVPAETSWEELKTQLAIKQRNCRLWISENLAIF